jgi:cohesin complex subunit SCC1
MFYSDAILSKKVVAMGNNILIVQGPLAKVWLAAHERKLTKAQLLQTSITRSTQAIVEQEEAPLALRLSGQLLLGVVRIYSRKARYLLDDCNEAVMKIKLAFRPGNVDLPATQQTSQAHALLTLPDTLTELDLLLPPDPTVLSQSMASGRDTTLLSNAYDLSIELPRGLRDEDDPLSQFQNEDGEVLDFALDDSRSFSVERGRDAMSVNLEDEFGSIKGFNDDLDLGVEKRSALGEEDDGLGGGFGEGGFGEELNFGFGEDLPIAPIQDTGITFISHLTQTLQIHYYINKTDKKNQHNLSWRN